MVTKETVQTSHSPGEQLAIDSFVTDGHSSYIVLCNCTSLYCLSSLTSCRYRKYTSFHNALERVNGWSYLAMDCDEIVSCVCTKLSTVDHWFYAL